MTATQMLEEIGISHRAEMRHSGLGNLPRGVGTGQQRGAEGGRKSKHISPVSKFTPDQGHRTFV